MPEPTTVHAEDMNLSQAGKIAHLDAKGVSYQLFSLLLSYPDDSHFISALTMARDWVQQFLLENPGVTMDALLGALDTLSAKTDEELAVEYVSTFDFRESTSLYLTAHELGDSRSRGPAMVALRNMLHHYGYEEATAELPDFLPALFEFLSELSPDERPFDLEQRVAKVCREINSHLPPDSHYKPVFEVMTEILPEVPADANPFPLREKADTDELPYPLLYD